MPEPSPTEDKRALRAAARRRRSAQPVPDAAELEIAAAILPLVPGLRHGGGAGVGSGPTRGRVRPPRVACYLSLPHEPPTGALVAALLARGTVVLVPVTLPDFDLDWRPVRPGETSDAATVTRRAVRTEDAALGPEAIGEVDLVVAPALLVDRAGRRLGQGGGCYDRALARVPEHVPVVALVHDAELVDGTLPEGPHDRRVSAVVTTSGSLSWLGRPSA